MMNMTYLFPSLLLLLAGAGQAAPESPIAANQASFARNPSATKTDGATKVSFAVSAPTDVEVTILGAQGREIRHLAAGQLGAKEAAAPLTAGSLSQSIAWDGKDDRGNPAPVAEGPFKARVRLGLAPGGARVVASYPKTVGKGKSESWNTSEPFAPGVPGLSPAQAGSLKNKDSMTTWFLDADKEDDRLYFGIEFNLIHRYLGKDQSVTFLDVCKKDSRIADSIFGFSVDCYGNLVWSPYFLYDRNLKEVPPPSGLNTHPALLTHNYGFMVYLRARPMHEYWSGTFGVAGLDGRVYHRIGYQIPYQRVIIWDTWQKGRAVTDGYQKFVSSARNRGHSSCIRVDTAGNMYVTMHGGPEGVTPPAPRVKAPFAEYASIVKFDPSKRWVNDFTFPYSMKPADPEEAKGALPWSEVEGEYLTRFERVYPYVMGGVPGGCNCKAARFDLDEYGRLFVPDLCQERVLVLDNAGNRIFTVQDSTPAEADGKGAKLHLGWPARLAVSRQAIYFSDPVNNRIMRLALTWRTEDTCPLPPL
jgi:hypothetical protein